ncbi:tetratricopeptide repeat protein [Pedobacter sp. LMG 31464]|uniref:histidine kinase n=1 Tax=Pedobacter planticolens TaxID=2679964 RepID=A0A923DYM6_9SPHI|nr:sensor histidine kinase [Pedobacter planticolens]MBB2146466.1 tetratricopeptide repeat protein [Pedobacter planticolens]
MKKILTSITTVLGLFVLSLPVIAQQNKLLDSAKNIFRAQPELASSLLVQVKTNAIKANDNNSLIAAELIEGNIAYFKGKHNEALKIYLHALGTAEKNNLHEDIAAICNEIGTLFKKNKDFKKALNYYTRALNEAININDNAQIANSHNNIGLVYEEDGAYQNALKQYQKSLQYYQKAKDKLGESYSLEYIGYVFGLMKNYDFALEYLQKSLSLRRELKDNYGIAVCLIELTEINRDKKDFNQAIVYAKQAISFCKEINYPDMLQQGYLLLSEIYEQKKDFAQAYQAHKNYATIKDSIFNVAKSKQINELQTQYDTEKKEQKISILHKENTIQKLKLTQRDGIIITISLAFLLSSIIGYLLYNRYKLRQNSRLQNEVIAQQDLATKAVLTAEENERKRIAGELHDGLGQMFSAVKLNLSALADHFEFKDEHGKKMYGKTLNLVDESCKEVRVISHQMAPNVLLKAGLASAIRDFIDKIDVKKLKVNLSTFGLQDRLDQNIEIVLYRVIQEAVNNVIKHAKANSLDIQLTKDEEGINAMIEDNGKGFDITQLEKFEGIGLKNIRTRVIYLNGTVDFSSKPGQGTLIAIFIPF